MISCITLNSICASLENTLQIVGLTPPQRSAQGGRDAQMFIKTILTISLNNVGFNTPPSRPKLDIWSVNFVQLNIYW